MKELKDSSTIKGGCNIIEPVESLNGREQRRRTVKQERAKGRDATC